MPTSPTRVFVELTVHEPDRIIEPISHIVPDWANRTLYSATGRTLKDEPWQAAYAIGRCDATRETVYAVNRSALLTARRLLGGSPVRARTPDAPDVLVHQAYGNIAHAFEPPRGNRTRHLFFTLEPPAHLPFTSLNGFTGTMSFRTDATVWRPHVRASKVWKVGRDAAASVVPAERRTVGVWVDNCAPRFRTSVIEQLLQAADIHVESFGRCHFNLNQSSQGLRLLGDPRGQLRCHRHRLMLAIENHVCTDWVSDNLQNAVECGAIPIVRSAPGVPLYARFGAMPHVDVARPDWLSEVREIMRNDSHYLNLLKQWRAVAPSPKVDGWYHCQWHSQRLLHGRPGRRRISWNACAPG